MADRLNLNEDLTNVGSIISKNGKFKLAMQGDGNLVLYRSTGQALWSTSTHGRTVSEAIMQDDGNFVMYGPGRSVIWQTATCGNPGAWLTVKNNGNVVIYDSAGNQLWESKSTVSRFGPFNFRKRNSLTGGILTDAIQIQRERAKVKSRVLFASFAMLILVISVIILWHYGLLDRDSFKVKSILILILFTLIAERYIRATDFAGWFNWLSVTIVIPLLLILLFV